MEEVTDINKWMETLTEENLKTREKSVGRKITIINI